MCECAWQQFNICRKDRPPTKHFSHNIAAVTTVASELMDGNSYLWMLKPRAPALAAAPKIIDETEIAEEDWQQKPPPPLRIDFLAEYHGELEHDDQYVRVACSSRRSGRRHLSCNCPRATPRASSKTRRPTLSYSCLRTLVFNPPTKTNSTIFCRFYADDTKWRAGEEYLTENYDIEGDPWVTRSRWQMRSPNVEQALLRARLDGFRACTGSALVPRLWPERAVRMVK